MDASFEITVTQDDILHSTQASPHDCAIARAVKRLYPDKHPFVCPAILIVTDAEGQHEFDLPQVARDLQTNFDLVAWDDFDKYNGDTTFTVTRHVPRPRALPKAGSNTERRQIE